MNIVMEDDYMRGRRKAREELLENHERETLFDSPDYTVEKFKDTPLILLDGENCHRIIDLRQQEVVETLVHMQRQIDGDNHEE